MKHPAPRTRTRAGRRNLVALLVGALVASLGVAGASGAVAAPPEVTFSLRALEPSVGVPIAEAAAGERFQLSANVGCPDPNGCGPAELRVTFPEHIAFLESGFAAPPGALVTVSPEGSGTDRVVTLTWESLDGTAVVFLPAEVPRETDAGAHASTASIKGVLTAGVDADIATITDAAELVLRVPDVPGLAATGHRWAADSVQEQSGTATSHSLTATAEANSLSSLTFRFPSNTVVPEGLLPSGEAFDLTALELNQNPSGATVRFSQADGAETVETLSPERLRIDAPDNAVGAEIVVADLPSRASASSADRTVIVTALSELRDTQRSSGERIIAPPSTSRTVRASGEIVNTISVPAEGEPATREQLTFADIRVSTAAPSLGSSLIWLTASEDSSSVYGSQESSTATVRLANTGLPALSEVTVRVDAASGSFFEYQRLTAGPAIEFPDGADHATIRYTYQTADGAETGELREFGPQDPTPEPKEDDRELAEVSGVTIVFVSEAGIPGSCALAADCAAEVVLPGALRDTRLSNGAGIVPPTQNPGTTTVSMTAFVALRATSGTESTANTPTAQLRIVKPQYTTTLSKRFGDGTQQTVYPSTGIASPGDLYVAGRDPQNYADHPLRFVVETAAVDDTNEPQGATGFTIRDPQLTPELDTLPENPFNTIRVTQLPAIPDAQASCVTPDGTPVESTTEREIWVVDQLGDPQNIERVAEAAPEALDRIVGIELRILPTAANGEFPRDVRCATPDGLTVGFRDALVSDGTQVSPANLAPSETPGLVTVANTAEVVTGTNLPSAVGSDRLTLLEEHASAVSKAYAPEAPAFGVAGQETRTGFALAGVPDGAESYVTRIVDGGLTDRSLDIFALTNVRDARVGPDQRLRVDFRDLNGDPVGPVGTVEPGTTIADRPLNEEEIEDSQSAGYREFHGITRMIDWDGEWDAGERAQVFEVRVTLQRSEAERALQRYGTFSVIVDATLRTTRLSDPAREVTGTPEGTPYVNIARIESRDAPASDPTGNWRARPEGTAEFTVFAPSTLIGGGRVTWNSVDGDGYLVAKHGTNSRVVLEADNRTAVGASGVAPEEQWATPGSVPVGVERINVTTGWGADGSRNPFAILNFAGVTRITWPLRADAPIWGSEAERRVAGTLSYRLSDGSTVHVPAPVNADLADLNPPKERWGQVVGVTVTWAEPGKLVGAKHPEGAAGQGTGGLEFTAALRDFVRAGHSFTFTSGDPVILGPGASIEGGVPSDAGLVQRRAMFAAEYRGERAPLEDATGEIQSDELAINSAAPGVSATLEPTRNGTVYRDTASRPGQDTEWNLTARNTSNFPVENVRLASESALLAGDWNAPSSGPGAPAPGTLFDTSNVVQARLSYPQGAASAEVRVRDASGAWTAAIPAGNGQAISLPAAGSGPQRWEDATGIRVQFAAASGVDRLIAKNSDARLVLTTRLRETLRSDPNQQSPAAQLPDGKTVWESAVSGAGGVYNSIAAGPLATATNLSSLLTVRAGTPAPRALKFASHYDPNTNTGNTAIQANPGSWVNFALVLENQSSATSNLYGLSIDDALPPELQYNAVSEAYAWRVERAPEGVSTTPELSITADGGTRMRWVWPEDQVLRPGERIVLRVPLQLSDGLPAGHTTLNTARVVGSGIPNAPNPSACANDQATAAVCTARASVDALRVDSVRLESYLDATVGGSSTGNGQACDVTTVASWADGTWVRNPCLANTTVDGTLKYRVKVINSGNSALTSLRFVNELPKIDDQGAVLQAPRGSAWTPTLIPDSVRLLSGKDATELGARGDAVLHGDTFRYSATPKPCTLEPDAYGAENTLECAAGDWSTQSSAASQAFGGDLGFEGTEIRGGEYVLIDFEMRAPATGIVPSLSWNSAAGTGRTSPFTIWQPASESPKSGARAQDTDLFLTLALGEGAATPWHVRASGYELTLACLTPGETVPVERVVKLPGIDTPHGTRTARVSGLPRGGTCEVTDERYEPTPGAAAGQYGLASEGVTGFSFSTDPSEPIELVDDPAENTILVVTEFAETTLRVGVDVAGDAADVVPEDAAFEVAVACDFGGVSRELGPFAIVRGETETLAGLPVGVNCTAMERDHRGAAEVTATVNGAPAELDENRGVGVTTLDPGTHEIRFTNTFAAGGDLTVLKTVELPRAGLAAGDVAFETSCELGGYPLRLGERGTLGLSFAPGEFRTSGSIPGLPAGAECTVRETEAGGAHAPAPDRTVTVLPQDEVIVEMVNTVHPAALELAKDVTGPGASEDRVPETFGIQATCTRELTIGGVVRTVTDYDGLSRVAPGAPVTIADLPAGARCEVSEPDPAGAERTTIVPSEVPELEAGDAAPEHAVAVALTGPDAAGAVVPTAVRVENFYAATDRLSVTGTAPMLWAAAAALLLMASGALVLRNRRTRR